MTYLLDLAENKGSFLAPTGQFKVSTTPVPGMIFWPSWSPITQYIYMHVGKTLLNIK